MPSFDTPAPVTLSVELDSGDVSIDASTSGITEVDLRPARAGDADALALIDGARVDHSGDRVTVHLPGDGSSGLFRRSAEIALTVRLPVGSTFVAKLRSADLRVRGELEDVRVDTASGAVTLADIAGSAVVVTASGDVRAATVGGPLRVKTVSGDVELGTCCAACTIESASGDITLGAVEGDLSVKSASGDVVIEVAEASVSARTASGDIDLRQVRAGTVEVDSVSGDVGVAVERGASVYLDVSSLSGGVSSSLEPADSAVEGAPTLELRVKTVSGDIRLQPV